MTQPTDDRFQYLHQNHIISIVTSPRASLKPPSDIEFTEMRNKLEDFLLVFFAVEGPCAGHQGNEQWSMPGE